MRSVTKWHQYLNIFQAERNLIRKTLGNIFADILKNKKYCGVNKVGEEVAIDKITERHERELQCSLIFRYLVQ